MTNVNRCFMSVTKWHEDRIHPDHFVSLLLAGNEFNEILEWAKDVLEGDCKIHTVDDYSTMIDNIIFYHVIFRLSNEDDIFTMKMTWG